ncbi:5'-nucleotidase C-terminal domain-containing protein [Solicola sp. PLA-1-18]|uniref:5'-nucleotidase C-terminal domain-containing protein n=1 Tax=Solicola sp. PLA-1-18 TaxID=3380532 RepID=UPI003B807F98
MPQRSTVRSRSVTALAAVVALVAAPLTVLVTSTPAQAAPTTITLLNINDFHGRIAPATQATAGAGPWSGTTAWAAVIEQQRAAAGAANTALLSAGDNIGASLYASSSQQDTPTLDVLNTLQTRASAVGNHEFDKGFADLTGRVDDEADFPYLGANVYRKGTTTPALPEYTVIDVAGVKVGVVGVVTQETPTLVSPAGVSTLDFGEPVAAVNRVAAQLRDGNDGNGEADVVVAEYHEGGALAGTATLADQKAASAVFSRIVDETSDDVAAIFTGHTHQAYAYDDGGRPVVQTGSYGANIAKVQLTVDPETDAVSAATGSVVAATTSVDPATLYATYPKVQQVGQIVSDAVARAKQVGSVAVGSTKAAITRARTSTGTEDRGAESTLGNLVGNALRDTLAPARLGGAEIGVVNPGGLRADLDAGTVTAEEANNVLPFANNLNTITLTGAQFKNLLEQQWQTNADGSVPSRAYLQLGLSDNVSYTFDPTQPRGSRITSILVDGKPIDPARGYRIGTFSFLQQGGDNFREFRNGTNPQDSGLVDFDGWVAYLKAHPGLTPSFARRSTQATGFPATVTAGQQVSATLSSLDLTSGGSPANTSVTVTLVPQTAGARRVVVGTFPVSAGSASVSFTAPASLSGTYSVTAVASPSGTTVGAPLPPKATPTVTATGSSIAYGGTPTVRVTVSSTPTATGRVQVSRKGTVIGSGTLINGRAIIALRRSVLKPGTSPVSVTYLGDADVAARSTKTTIRVAKSGALVDARVTTSPVVVGRSRARVVAVVDTRTGVAARGTVRVRLGGKTVGTAKVGRNGKAVIRLKAFTSPGRKTLSVKYLGSSTVKAKTDTVRVTVRRR